MPWRATKRNRPSWIAAANPEGYQPAPDEKLSFDFNVVTPDYFQTLGAVVVSGHPFSAIDAADAPRVAMINEATARRYWPGQDAIGKRLHRGPQALEIVGVVRDGKDRGLTKETRPAIVLPGRCVRRHAIEPRIPVRRQPDRSVDIRHDPVGIVGGDHSGQRPSRLARDTPRSE